MNKDRVLIITGTRKGIGRSLAEHYLNTGAKVAGCSRSPSDLEHPAYTHYTLDVSDEKKAVHMVRDIAQKQGRIDVLINNAGIASMNHIMTTPYRTVQNIFSTNFFGSFLFARETAKVFMKQKQGRIVNFATVATPLNLEGEAIYAASKAAVTSFTRIASRELAPFNITVNAVGPTPVPTDLIRSVPGEKMESLLERQAIRRYGEIADIINVIDFFISEKSDFITGQVLYLGGVCG